MRRPQIRKATPGREKSWPDSAPAPIGGWNARDPLAKMPKQDAFLLDNWFPQLTDVTTRGGAEYWLTDVPEAVHSLMEYNGASSSKLFAATDMGIYNASSAGAAGAAEIACTNGYFSFCQFATLGGFYLFAVNGFDDMKRYDGTTWTDVNASSTPAITGLATNRMICITVFKRRIWVVEKDSLSAWYLPVDVVGGAMTEFPIGPLCSEGGHLLYIGTWTIDAGDGADDRLVLITSKGQILVYQGVDPSDPNDFFFVGVYKVGAPVNGRQGITKFAGDMLILTENGLFPLSKALQSSSVRRDVSISSKVERPLSTAVRDYGANPGWQVFLYPKENALLVNIPQIADSQSVQFVMNTISGSWCRFYGWNATCMAVFNKQLFIGGPTWVARAWYGTSDFDGNIVADARQAPNYFGSMRTKGVKLVRPILKAAGGFSYELAVDADFSDESQFTSISIGESDFAEWDVDDWDEALWAPDTQIEKSWQTVFSWEGQCHSVRLRCSSRLVNVSWISTDYILEPGGML